jgi:hypothetical protein
MDVRDLKFDDATFDVVMDKGTRTYSRDPLRSVHAKSRYNGRNVSCSRQPMGRLLIAPYPRLVR